jgi:uncharacterized protein
VRDACGDCAFEELPALVASNVVRRHAFCLGGQREGESGKSKRTILRRISPRFTSYGLGVGRSRIHGTGVYALENIPPGRRIVEYVGRKLTHGQAARLKFPKDMYLAKNKLGSVIDGRIGGNGSQFINHSCKPNVKFVRSRGRIFYETLRGIQAGEELSVRYGYPSKVRRVPCRCGARNCRGTLRLIFEP